MDGSAEDGVVATSVYRIPTDGDHPWTWTMVPALAVGGFVVVIAAKDDTGRRPGFDLPVSMALVIGLAVALVVGIAFGLRIRRAPRDLALRLEPDRVAFTEGATERWSIPWAAVTSAGIVHATAPTRRYQPVPAYLRLELAEGAVPRDPSLHGRDGAWWFSLTGSGAAGRLHRDLVHRLPGRTRPVETGARIPTRPADHGRSR